MTRNTRYTLCISYCAFLFFLAACGSASATPAYFIPPSSPPNTPTPALSVPFVTPEPPISIPMTPAPTIEVSPSPEPLESPSPTPECISSLKYLEDINYLDGTLVSPGQSIEKQWRVENNGSCDWNSQYRLKLSENYLNLGAKSEMALYPARSGTQAVLTINFTAPLEGGTYRTSWQAADANGNLFGDAIYMEIIVQP